VNLSNKRTRAAIVKQSETLKTWYKTVQRDLPWRRNSDPYKIWLSEVMLQQTTVQAVIPYFEKFIKKFPTVKTLAKAELETVYQYWAGLGYYSRARSLHKAAKALVELGTFPDTHLELLKLPGLGDYTARAVASIAFGEKVGVVDGNVIRVLSRLWDQEWEWWKTQPKRELQKLSDAYAASGESATLNQALMELGATVCRPKSPTCLLCPLKASCKSLKNDTIDLRPLRRARRKLEIWHWQAAVVSKGKSIALVKNKYAPFLKDQWILPGKVVRKFEKPKRFDFKHGVTHHSIFVSVASKTSNFVKNEKQDMIWVTPKQLKEKVPYALVQKAVALGLVDKS